MNYLEMKKKVLHHDWTYFMESNAIRVQDTYCVSIYRAILWYFQAIIEDFIAVDGSLLL